MRVVMRVGSWMPLTAAYSPEQRLHRRVAHRRAVGHLDDTRRKFRAAVDAERQRDGADRDVHETIATLRATVRELRRHGSSAARTSVSRMTQ